MFVFIRQTKSRLQVCANTGGDFGIPHVRVRRRLVGGLLLASSDKPSLSEKVRLLSRASVAFIGNKRANAISENDPITSPIARATARSSIIERNPIVRLGFRLIRYWLPRPDRTLQRLSPDGNRFAGSLSFRRMTSSFGDAGRRRPCLLLSTTKARAATESALYDATRRYCAAWSIAGPCLPGLCECTIQAMIFARGRPLGKFYCQTSTNPYGPFQRVV
jgi:hypothetical protein